MKYIILFLILIANIVNAYDYVLTDGTNVVGSNLKPIVNNSVSDNKSDLSLYYNAKTYSQLYNMSGWFMDAFVNTTGVNQASSTGISYSASTYINRSGSLPYDGVLLGQAGAGNCVYTGNCWGSYQPIANGAFSISFWFKFSASSPGATVFFSTASAIDPSHYGFILDYNYVSANKLDFIISGGNYFGFTWTADTAWHHFVATYTNIATTGMQVWLDGSQGVQGSATAYSTNYDDRVHIGCTEYGGNTVGFNGYMDQFLIYNRELQPAEIAYLYNSGSGKYHDTTTNFNGIMSGFEFDDIAGTTLTDFSANNWNAGSTGTIGRTASTIALMPGVTTNMVLQSVTIPYSTTATTYRTVVLSNTTNVHQKVSVNGSDWYDVVLKYIGMISTSPTQLMYSSNGLILTNATSTTNVYFQTLCNSNSLNTIYGQGITYQ